MTLSTGAQSHEDHLHRVEYAVRVPFFVVCLPLSRVSLWVLLVGGWVAGP